MSSLVGELIDFGLVRETEVELRGTVGRPALPVELSGHGVVGLGLELGVDFLAVRAADLAGDERHRALVTVDNRGRPVDDVLGDLARARLRRARRRPGEQGLVTVGAAIALPGPRRQRAVACSWRRTSAGPASTVPTLLSERMGAPPFPLQVENEANLGALAELWQGAGRDFATSSTSRASSGVGAGIIVGGELFRGAHGFGGELGHIDGRPARATTCACGNRGCLETRVALGAMLHAAGLEPTARVAELAERAEAGDERAVATLEEAGRWLGVAVASAANLLNPRGVVIGGYFATLAPWLAPGARGRAGGARAVGRVGRAGRRHVGARRRGRGARRGRAGAAPGLPRPGARRRAARRV